MTSTTHNQPTTPSTLTEDDQIDQRAAEWADRQGGQETPEDFDLR